MFICAYVAHAYVTTATVFDASDIRVDVLVVQKASLNFAYSDLGSFDRWTYMRCFLPCFEKKISKFFHYNCIIIKVNNNINHK